MKKIITLFLALILMVQVVPTVSANTNQIIIEGTVEVIDVQNRRITILDWEDNLKTIGLPEDTKISDIYFGQEVKATLINGLPTTLELIEPEDPTRDAYISPGTRFRVGTVLFISNEEIEIITTKAREKYKIDPFSTTLYKNDQIAQLISLKEGDRVLLTFDDPMTSTVSEIKIEDAEKQIAGVLKGKIEFVDERNKEIVISQPKVLNQGDWVSTTAKTKIKIGTGVIYEGSKKLTLSDLQKRKGMKTYIAYENSFGTQTVGKMILKSGTAMEYNDLLDDIDYGVGKIVVDTKSFNIHDGTIVIKDNRLVDNLNLNQYQDLYVIADYKNGARQASVISIEGTSILEDRIDGSKLLIYKAKIEDVLDYKVVIGNNFRLDKTVLGNTGFVYSKESEDLIVTDDTIIYDSDLEKEIHVKAFLDSKYIDLIDVKDRTLRNRIKKDYYKNKPAYIIARETEFGKEILSINLIPQENVSFSQTVQLDYSSLGKITSINQENNTIELENVTNYNALTKRWEKGTKETLDLTQAIILVNDKPMPIEEIYKIRKNSTAYLVKQKETSNSTTYIMIIEE